MGVAQPSTLAGIDACRCDDYVTSSADRRGRDTVRLSPRVLRRRRRARPDCPLRPLQFGSSMGRTTIDQRLLDETGGRPRSSRDKCRNGIEHVSVDYEFSSSIERELTAVVVEASDSRVSFRSRRNGRASVVVRISCSPLRAATVWHRCLPATGHKSN